MGQSGKRAALTTVGLATQIASIPAWSCALGNVATASSGFNNLISIVCWAGGLWLSAAGAYRIRKRRKDRASQSFRGIAIRLCCGLFLLALPFIQSAMQGSVDSDNLHRGQAQTVIMDRTEEFK